MDWAFNSFALTCSCGEAKWRVRGNWFEGETAEFIGPLFAECSTCGRALRIIDTSIHGYDGEIGDGIVEEHGAKDLWTCPQCSMHEGSLIVSCGYQYDPDQDIASHPQDFFDAFILTHLCTDSGKPVQITVFECA